MFDLSSTSDAYWLTLLNPARFKFGFRHRPQARFLYDVALPRAFMKFEAESNLDQLGILCIDYDWPLNFGYPPAPPMKGPPYLLYFTTASTTIKSWLPERYGQLMAWLAEQYPHYEHRLLYGVKDWEIAAADTVLSQAQGRPNVVAVRESTGQHFQDLVRRATMLIANDTGVRNLAISYHTPTLGIMPISLVYTYLPRFGHHAAVWDFNGGQPEVEKMREAAVKLLNRIEQAQT